MDNYIFTSSRLGFRNWIDQDIDALTTMNNDPEVMRFFPKLYRREECRDFISRMQSHFEIHGFNYFVVERLHSEEFLGFIGICHQTYTAPFTPCVDIGWRLKRTAWGKGIATEGAKRVLEYAFDIHNLESLYAVAPLINTKSQKVMQKIGMHEILVFDHPMLVNSPDLSSCVVYQAINTSKTQ